MKKVGLGFHHFAPDLPASHASPVSQPRGTELAARTEAAGLQAASFEASLHSDCSLNNVAIIQSILSNWARGASVVSKAMWDDEDNNPYGSFHRRDSETSDIQSPGPERSFGISCQGRVMERPANSATYQASTDLPRLLQATPRPNKRPTSSPDLPISATKSLKIRDCPDLKLSQRRAAMTAE